MIIDRSAQSEIVGARFCPAGNEFESLVDEGALQVRTTWVW